MRISIFVLISIVVLSCSACTDTKNVQGEIGVEKKVQLEEFDEYQILNDNLLGKDFLRWTGEELIEKGACEYAEEVKEEFVPIIKKDVDFPEELVVMLEEILYYSGHIEMGQENSFYQNTLNKLGGDVYLLELEELYVLFPQIETYQIQSKEEAYDIVCRLYGGPSHCNKIFRFSFEENKSYYVFEYSQGGSNGACSICVTEYTENEFKVINEFEIQNEGQGKVICYEGEFYYIFIQYNYNLKACDGIRIHKLIGTQYENLLIRYLPKHFVWKCLYYGISKVDDDVDINIDTYIDIIKEELTFGGYIDDGRLKNGMPVYYGDEEMMPDMVIDSSSLVSGAYEPIAKIDLANCNLPVFLWKTEYVPSNTGTSEYLKIKFFYYEENKQAFLELEELSEENWSNHINLVQMWFKEICGEMYTFKLYHINDYNYMLNVVHIEENEITQIRNFIVVPQREFVLTEGEIFVTD